MDQMTIRQKLYAVFSVLILIFTCISLYSGYTLYAIHHGAMRIATEHLNSVLSLSQANRTLAVYRKGEYAMVAATNTSGQIYAAQEIRKSDTEVCIIFITNMPQYAIKGYTVGALDYILKPVSYYSFSQTITRALGRRKTVQNKYVILNVKGGMRRIAVSSIRYIEVMNHDLIFHLSSEEIASRGALKEVEKELSGEFFFQCNKGFLINLAYVDGIVGNDVQIGEDQVQVSRSRKKPLMEALNQYMEETGR